MNANKRESKNLSPQISQMSADQENQEHLAISHWQLALCFDQRVVSRLPRDGSGADPSGPIQPLKEARLHGRTCRDGVSGGVVRFVRKQGTRFGR